MKIYNRKKFAVGVLVILLATVNLLMDVVNQTTDVNGIILVTALYLFGFGAVLRSLSKKLTREDKLEELDERNQLIALKSKSKAFVLAEVISFVLMLGLLVMGKVSGNTELIAIGVGLAFAVAILMLTELFTSMYYEEKN